MNLKAPASGRAPAPGVQQQQQAEAVSKQRQAAQAAQVQAQAQQNAAAQSAYAMQMNQYQQAQAPPVYNNVYATNQPGQPPPYPTQSAYAPPTMGMLPQQQGYGHPQQTLYAQATTRAGRQRASTMDQQQGSIPASIQSGKPSGSECAY
jgi:dual specificity protein kinase YAK1